MEKYAYFRCGCGLLYPMGQTCPACSADGETLLIGHVDESFVFDRALTQEEIERIHFVGKEKAMQSFDEKGKLTATEMLKENEDLFKKLKDIESEFQEKTLHHVIGRIPLREDRIMINGLLYKVTYSDVNLGEISAKLLSP